MSRYPLFPKEKIRLQDAAKRHSQLRAVDVQELPSDPTAGGLAAVCQQRVGGLAEAIILAKRRGKPRIMFFGAHVIKRGLSRFIVDMIKHKWVTHLATNGAGLIHDYELCTEGATSEVVSETLPVGHFGMWYGLQHLNLLAKHAVAQDECYGEHVGRYLQSHYQRDYGIFGAAYEESVPCTVHPLLGGDITHMLPGANWGDIGTCCQQDFWCFTQSVAHLDSGVFMNVGSAVHGPEVFLKALSAARNVQYGHPRIFTTAVFDLVKLPAAWASVPAEQPPRAGDDPGPYYFRPWKTILRRAVPAGESHYYLHGDHAETIPALWKALHYVEKEQYANSRS